VNTNSQHFTLADVLCTVVEKPERIPDRASERIKVAGSASVEDER
jgi:hypothetical protein